MDQKVKNMSGYKLQYKTRLGAYMTDHTHDAEYIEKKLIALHKSRIEAIVRLDNGSKNGNKPENGEEVGRVWRDPSQKPMWNWYFNKNIKTQ